MSDYRSELEGVTRICTRQLAIEHGVEPFCACPSCNAERAATDEPEKTLKDIGKPPQQEQKP